MKKYMDLVEADDETPQPKNHKKDSAVDDPIQNPTEDSAEISQKIPEKKSNSLNDTHKL